MGGSVANAFDFNVNTGTYTLTLNGGHLRSLNFTGFTGTWSPGTNSVNFYGSVTFVPGMTFTTGTGTFTWGHTSGTATLTSAGKTLYNVTQSGAGGTLAFSDAAILNILTISAGTLQLPISATTTVTSFVTSGTTLKYLTSSSSGAQATISKASGATTVTYLSIKDSNATGGTWQSYLTDNNVNAGNNAGWLFSPSIPSSFFLLF